MGNKFTLVYVELEQGGVVPYKMFSIKVPPFKASAIVIVTAYKNPGGYFRAESFCVLPDPHVEKIFKTIGFKNKDFGEIPIKIDEEFMLEEAILQARTDIGIHIENNYANDSSIIDNEFSFNEIYDKEIAHLHTRNKAEFLCDIISSTQYEPLRTSLISILKIPQIIQKNL